MCDVSYLYIVYLINFSVSILTFQAEIRKSCDTFFVSFNLNIKKFYIQLNVLIYLN